VVLASLDDFARSRSFVNAPLLHPPACLWESGRASPPHRLITWLSEGGSGLLMIDICHETTFIIPLEPSRVVAADRSP